MLILLVMRFINMVISVMDEITKARTNAFQDMMKSLKFKGKTVLD